MTRFWEEVSVDREAAGDYSIRLDGRAVRLPGGASLAVPSSDLAEAIAAEWREIPAGAPFDPAALTLTRIAGTLVERVVPDPDASRAVLLNFGLSDLLIYREEALQEEQAALFDPILDIFAGKTGVRPRITLGLLPQSDETAYRQALIVHLASMDAVGLATLGVLTPALGSLILAFGLVDGWIEKRVALDAAFLEERAQMRQWGNDPDILDQLAVRDGDVAAGLRFLALSRQSEKPRA